MDHRALLRAIREPAPLYGGAVEPELAEAIIADFGRTQDQLPLMQHAMMLLHRDFGNGRAPADGATADEVADASPWRLGIGDYRNCGNVASLLSKHAHEAVEEYREPVARCQSDVAPSRAHVQVADPHQRRGRVISRPRSMGQLMTETGATEDELRAVIKPLRADGVSFLRIPDLPLSGLEPEGNDELVSISHEALIRNWDQLWRWTQEEAENGVIYRLLLSRTKDHRGDTSNLLHLREARERELWWREVEPTQLWADRYSAGYNDVSLADVRSLIDMSLDPQVQEFSFWREQIENARIVWTKDPRPDALLQGYALMQAKHWLCARPGDISEEGRQFIVASVTERDHRAAQEEAAERQREEDQRAAAKAREEAQAAELARLRAEEKMRIEQRRREKLVVALGLVLLLAAGALLVGYAISQRHNASQQFALAVSSAEKLLEKIGSSVEHGDLTTKGAEEMLQVPAVIVNQVAAANSSLLIKNANMASDIYTKLGNYKEAYARAQAAKIWPSRSPSAIRRIRRF